MEWQKYRRQWWKRARAGTLGKAQAIASIFVLLTSPIGIWWKPLGDYMNWAPTLIFTAGLVVLLAYGLIKAPHWLHDDLEKELDDARNELTRADRIEGVLIELGRLRKSGTDLRNDLAKKDVLDQNDQGQVDQWHSDTTNKIREISPPRRKYSKR